MDLVFYLYIVSLPVALLATVGVLGWRFRHLVASSMGTSEGDSQVGAAGAAMAQATAVGSQLLLRRFEAAEVGLASGQAAAALSEAEAIARSARLAYTAAGLAYLAITTLALTLGMPAKIRTVPVYGQFILVYLQQFPPVFLLVWFLGISLPARLAILGGYLLLGLLTVPFARSLSYAATGAAAVLQLVLPPMMGLLLLLARPLRPWLIGVFSILIFLVTGTAVAMLFGLHRLDLSGMKTAWVVAGIMFLVIAVVGVATRLVALACGSSSFAVGDGVVDFLAVTELRSWTISSPTAVDSFARQCAPSLRRLAAI